jgi:hypothetical protein
MNGRYIEYLRKIRAVYTIIRQKDFVIDEATCYYGRENSKELEKGMAQAHNKIMDLESTIL